MSLWTPIETAIANDWDAVKSWVKPEEDALEAGLSELESEIEKNGPQLVFDACVAALTSVGTPGLATGDLIKAAADAAITTLKGEGLTDITAMVYGSISAALLKMKASAAAIGVTVPASVSAAAPAPAPEPSPAA